MVSTGAGEPFSKVYLAVADGATFAGKINFPSCVICQGTSKPFSSRSTPAETGSTEASTSTISLRGCGRGLVTMIVTPADNGSRQQLKVMAMKNLLIPVMIDISEKHVAILSHSERMTKIIISAEKMPDALFCRLICLTLRIIPMTFRC